MTHLDWPATSFEIFEFSAGVLGFIRSTYIYVPNSVKVDFLSLQSLDLSLPESA